MRSSWLSLALSSALLAACESNQHDTESFQQSNRGVYIFALGSFSREQCDLALSVFEGVENPRIGVLWGTFGDPTECLNRFVERFPRPKTIKVILHNETCRRPPRECEPFREVAADASIDEMNAELFLITNRIFDDVSQRTRDVIESIAVIRDEQTTLEIMTALEHNFTPTAAENHTAIVRGEVTDERLIINPVDHKMGARLAGADAIELHGLSATFAPGVACSWSNDGTDIDWGRGSQLREMAKWDRVRARAGDYERQGCDVWIWWNAQGLTQEHVAPSSREFSIDAEAIRQVNEWLRGQ